VKILVCDDHAVFRDGLRRVLAEIDADAELHEAGGVDEALALAAAHPDLELALLDLHMPGVAGLEGLRRLRAAFPSLPVAVVSAADDPALMRGALDLGAAGFVPKALGRGELAAAFRLVLAGGVYVPQAALAPSAPDVTAARRARRRERAAGLTGRQVEVLALLARGLTNKEIGDVLAIAENTVKVHVKAILEALEASNRTEAAVLARELDLKAPGEE
jgi:DNA-binding NarL/FixJ family response regulator